MWIKRDDLAHPVISGNKIRKLSFLMEEFRTGSCPGVLSFGGPHSNHIHALAWLCRYYQVPCTVFVRSIDHFPESATLEDIRAWGTRVIPISAVEYRQKDDPDQINLWAKEFPGYTFIPEGGSHPDAMTGIRTMMDEVTAVLPNPDLWICPVGTGLTLAGMVQEKLPLQKLIGISALKSSVLDIEMQTRWGLDQYPGWVMAQQWHWGGYGRVPGRLRVFIEGFRNEHGITLDPLYNGKAMYAFYQYARAGLIPAGSGVVFIHTGGLQGWRSLIS